MSRTFDVIHHNKEQNVITLSGSDYCTVFDDRWRTGLLDPRTWQVRLNQGYHTLSQVEFLSGSTDAILTINDGRESSMERKGLVKKHFSFSWNGSEYKWTKESNDWILRGTQSDAVIAERRDTGSTEGIISRVTVLKPIADGSIPQSQDTKPSSQQDKHLVSDNIEDELVLISALSIGAANIDGGVLTSRPPSGMRSAIPGREASVSGMAGPLGGGVC